MDKTGRERRREGGKAECLPAVSLCFSVCSAGKQERGRLVQRTVEEPYCGMRKKNRQQKPLNCIWNSPHTLSNSVFISWLDTASLLLAIARQWGAVNPLSFLRQPLHCSDGWDCCFLPSCTPHSQKLSIGTASLLGPVMWWPVLQLLSSPIGTHFPSKRHNKNTLH